MFNRDKRWSGEETLLVTRPNLFLSNKGIFVALILLGVIFYVYTATIQFVANLTVNTINFVQWPLTEYTAIFFLALGLLLVFYIIFKIISWSSYKYTITTARIITEKGIIRKRKSSMPYNTIQDVVINQGIIGRLIGIGSVILYSAYDGTDLELKQIIDPQQVEEMVFTQLQESKFNSQPITPAHNTEPQQNYNPQAQQYYETPSYDNMYNQEPQPQNRYPQNNPYQEPYNEYNPQQETHHPDYGFSTNVYTMDENERFYAQNNNQYQNPGNIKNQHSQTYPNSVGDRDFDNSIKEAMRNLDGDVKFRNPRNNLEPHNLFEELGKKETAPHDLFDDNNPNRNYQNQPHDLFEQEDNPNIDYQKPQNPYYQQNNSHFKGEYVEDAPYLNDSHLENDYVNHEEVEIDREDHRNLENSDVMERHSLKFKKKSKK